MNCKCGRPNSQRRSLACLECLSRARARDFSTMRGREEPRGSRFRKAPQARKSLSPRRKPWECQKKTREPRQGRYIVNARARECCFAPCRGSIGVHPDSHGLRRGLWFFRAFGAFRRLRRPTLATLCCGRPTSGSTRALPSTVLTLGVRVAENQRLSLGTRGC